MGRGSRRVPPGRCCTPPHRPWRAARPVVLPRPRIHALSSTFAPLCRPSSPRLEPCPTARPAGLLAHAPALGRGRWSAVVRRHRTLSQPRRAPPRPPASQRSAQVGRAPGPSADPETLDSGALPLWPHSAEGGRQPHSDTVNHGPPPDPKFEVSAFDCLLHTGQPPPPTPRTPPTGTPGVQPQGVSGCCSSHRLPVAVG